MKDWEKQLFNKLTLDRTESASMLEKRSMRGLKMSVVEKYSDQAHFIYELIQNADDVGATEVRFVLLENELVFVHNGTRRFTVSDVETEDADTESDTLGDINAITSIANSNKTDASIGKFGVGFKAVFQYTTTPFIYDPEISFKIERFIVPVLIDGECRFRGENETAFVFPFNHPDRDRYEAYSDIFHKLRNLVFPTLFLNNLKSVRYICGNEQGEYKKTIIEEKWFDDTQAECIRLVNGSSAHTDRIWLFSRRTPEGHKYSCGFFVDLDDKLVITDYYAFCFFPTKKDTNLSFIINAPFLLTDSREGIKATDKHNINMIDCLSGLAADCFLYLRDIGKEKGKRIIDDDILNYLPIRSELYEPKNPRDDLSFLPFFEKIKKVFKTEEVLPSFTDYVRADNAYLAYASTTAELFSNNQLAALTRNPFAKWVIPSKGGEALYRTRDGKYDYIFSLIQKQMIQDIQALDRIHPEFTEMQTEEWLFQLYEFILDREQRITKAETLPIFLDNHGKAAAAYDKNGNAVLFRDVDGSEYRVIQEDLLRNRHTVALADRLKIKAPELKDRIFNIVLKKEQLDPVYDFRMLLDYYIEILESGGYKQDYINLIRDQEFILGVSEDGIDKGVFSAGDLYIVSEDLKYYFAGAGESVLFVAMDKYERLVSPKEARYIRDFLIDLGVDVHVQMVRKTYDEDEARELFGDDWPRSSREYGWSEKYIHNDELVLQRIRDGRDKKLSKYLWEQLVLIFEEYYTAEEEYAGFYEYFYQRDRVITFEGEGRKRLLHSKWIFGKDGGLYAPDSISLQSLDYIYNLSGNAATRLIQFLGIKDEHPEYEELDDDLRTKLERYDRFVKLGLDKFPEDDIAEVLSLLNERKAALGEENDEAKPVIESKETEIINDLKKRIETKPTEQEETVVSQNEADVPPALPAPDDDVITKAAVNYSEKIEKAKKQFEKEIDVLARMEEAHEKAENCERYSYGWFSALLELEAIENGEDNARSREVSITFTMVERESSRMLVLKYPDKGIPQVVEELVDIPLDLTFKDGTTKKLIVEAANVRSFTVKAKIKPDPFVDSADFSELASAKISTQNPSFLLRELQKGFHSFAESPYNMDDAYDMQANLCANIDFVFGPPGTGKTTYLANETIIPLIRNNGRMKCIVLAPTNKAADVLTSRIIKSMGDDHSYEDWLIRFGVTFDDEIEESPVFKGREFDFDAYDKCVVVTTMVRFPYDTIVGKNEKFHDLCRINWDYVVVDEASMIPLVYMVYLMYLKTPKRFIVAGDPFQIEPTTAINDWKSENIYRMVNLTSVTDIGNTVPYEYSVKLLSKQYRSVPSIGEVFSRLTYNGVLTHHRTEDSRRLLNIDEYYHLESLNLIKFPVSKYESIYRAKRLKMSSYQVYAALFTYEFTVFLSHAISMKNPGENFSIGIISPYSAQAKLVDKLLVSSDIPEGITVNSDTIHGFQGDECDIIIALFNPPPYLSANSEMFLNRQNIVNVAISRAKDYLFILKPDDNTENIGNLMLINRLERLVKNDIHTVSSSKEIEERLFGTESYLEENAFATGHQMVNVYGLPERRYEVRSEETALDVQVYGESRYLPFEQVNSKVDSSRESDKGISYQIDAASGNLTLETFSEMIIGEEVTHSRYGKGTIRKVGNGYVYVDFWVEKGKMFKYPDSLTSFLKMTDEYLAEGAKRLVES